MTAVKRVTIVGVGALGSHLALALRNEAELRVIDFDRVEQKNVLAQFHGKPSVGKNKAEALKQSLQLLFGLKLEAVPHRLTADNARELLGGDLVIDCLDNAASRALVQAEVRRRALPCLHGALAADGQFGRVAWDETFAIDEAATGGGVATCEGGEHLPFIGVVSAYLARAAQVFLREGRRVGYQIHPGGTVAT